MKNNFKTCDKCKSRYLFFHLKSDCLYMKKRFEAFKTVLEKYAIDKQLEKQLSAKDFRDNILKAAWVQDEIDENPTILEGTRILSTPFILTPIITLIGIWIGVKFYEPVAVFFFVAGIFIFL